MKSRLFAAALAAVSLAVAGAAQAQDGRAGGTFGKVYFGVAGGMVMPEDVDFTANASQGGTTVSGGGKFQFDNGYALSAFAGYKINDYFRAEAELGYTQFDYDKVTGSFTATSGASTVTVAGSADIDGDVSAVTGMLRGIVTPLGKSRVTPFAGVGIGFAAVEESISRIDTTAVNASSDSTDLALDGTLGLEMDVTDTATLGARYRYMWVESGGSGVDDFTAHNIMATAAVRF